MKQRKILKKVRKILMILVIFHLVVWLFTQCDWKYVVFMRDIAVKNVWEAAFFAEVKKVITNISSSSVSALYPLTGIPAAACFMIAWIIERKMQKTKVPKPNIKSRCRYTIKTMKNLLANVDFLDEAKIYVHVVTNPNTGFTFDRIYNVSENIAYVGKDICDACKRNVMYFNDYNRRFEAEKLKNGILLRFPKEKRILNRGETAVLYMDTKGEFLFKPKEKNLVVFGTISII